MTAVHATAENLITKRPNAPGGNPTRPPPGPSAAGRGADLTDANLNAAGIDDQTKLPAGAPGT
ncbi:hypothetical protein GCM10022226_35110 [Sphaerisporangium flaviroseum]|uniref:Pentapeptide repeat-containing protein n=1 Tax=Sphaerisporangium flaviroseum TaxID=509199 RepID=A0ABP7I7K3_9ACTN